MEVIDSQIHRPYFPRQFDPRPRAADNWDWLDDEKSLAIDTELSIAAMDSVGVDCAAIVARMDFCVAAVRAHPDRFLGIASMPDIQAEDAEQFCAQIAEEPGMRGFRVSPAIPLSGEGIEMLRAGLFEPWWLAAQRHGLVACCYIPGHLDEARRIAERHPGLNFVLDHLGLPTPPVVPWNSHLLDDVPNLVALAALPNVSIKFSGAPCLSNAGFPFSDLWPALHQIIDAFGPDRLFWGSDYTRNLPLHSYVDEVHFLLHTSEIDEQTKEKILGQSLRTKFKWPRLDS